MKELVVEPSLVRGEVVEIVGTTHLSLEGSSCVGTVATQLQRPDGILTSPFYGREIEIQEEK